MHVIKYELLHVVPEYVLIFSKLVFIFPLGKICTHLPVLGTLLQGNIRLTLTAMGALTNVFVHVNQLLTRLPNRLLSP